MNKRTPAPSELRAIAKATAVSSSAVASLRGGSPIVLGLSALRLDAVAVGPAWPCRCPHGDNLALHRALASAPRGAVIVCDAGGDVRHGYFGELMAIDAKMSGVAGLVIDGAIRDGAAITQVGFPVFHRGFAARPCQKVSKDRTDGEVTLGGNSVTEADWVVADADGVALVSSSQWNELLAEVSLLEERERELKSAMATGARLAEVLFGGRG